LLLSKGQLLTVNLGTGCGISVLELIQAFERASGRRIPYQIVARRPGDIAVCYADTAFAKKCLGWSAVYKLEQMCGDSWRWQSMNPQGYSSLT
jgi:UDP-glucose 4-epimerase